MPKKKTEIVVETDADIEKVEVEDKPEDVGEINIGSYKAHLESTKKGMLDYKIWHTLTNAVVSMAYPNVYHRIDLRDKETLKKLEKDMEMKIDYEYISSQILEKPWLVQANGTFSGNTEKDPTKNENGKPLTKKALKANAKKDKLQAKIDVLQKKYDDMKSKKGPRAAKLKEKIEELEIKKDRL